MCGFLFRPVFVSYSLRGPILSTSHCRPSTSILQAGYWSALAWNNWRDVLHASRFHWELHQPFRKSDMYHWAVQAQCGWTVTWNYASDRSSKSRYSTHVQTSRWTISTASFWHSATTGQEKVLTSHFRRTQLWVRRQRVLDPPLYPSTSVWAAVAPKTFIFLIQSSSSTDKRLSSSDVCVRSPAGMKKARLQPLLFGASNLTAKASALNTEQLNGINGCQTCLHFGELCAGPCFYLPVPYPLWTHDGLNKLLGKLKRRSMVSKESLLWLS